MQTRSLKQRKIVSLVLAIIMLLGCMFSVGVPAVAYTDDTMDTSATTYYVAGDAGLVGVSWDPAGVAMEEQADGTYKSEFFDVPVGTYGWKVTQGDWGLDSFNEEGGGTNVPNASITLTTKADVTITFDPTTRKALATSEGEGEITDPVTEPETTTDPVTEPETTTDPVTEPETTTDPVTEPETTTDPVTEPETEPVPTYDYYVAGEPELTTAGWDPKGVGMELQEDGTYKVTFADIPAGTYQWKVTDGTWNNEFGESGKIYGGANQSFTTTADSDVTIMFNPATQIAVAMSEARTLPDNVYSVAGVESLVGEAWNPASPLGLMTEVSNGIFEIKFENIAIGEHQFKIVENQSWDNPNYGDPNGVDGNAVAKVTVEGINVTITFNQITKAISVEYTGTMGIAIDGDMKADVWANYATELKAEITNTEGETMIYDMSNGITIVDESEYVAFGQKYMMNSDIAIIEYPLYDTVTVRFFMDGDYDINKSTTPALNAENDKIFVIEIYNSYDIDYEGSGRSGLYDLQYNLTINYPNIEDATGQTTIARTEKIYVTSQPRSIIATIESKDVKYTFTVIEGSGYNALSDVVIDKAASIAKSYEVALTIFDSSPESLINEMEIYAVSQEGSQTTYNTYDETYEGFTSKDRLDTTYGRTVWLKTPEVLDGYNFKGWYDVARGVYVSLDAEYKFIITEENTKLVPVYTSSSLNPSDDPYAISAITAINEVYVDDTGVQKIKFNFPLTYFDMNNTVDAYKVRYQVVAKGEAMDPNGVWSDGIDVTDALNNEKRVNFYLTTNYSTDTGAKNEMTIYVQPYIEYNETDTTSDYSFIGTGEYMYMTY